MRLCSFSVRICALSAAVVNAGCVLETFTARCPEPSRAGLGQLPRQGSSSRRLWWTECSTRGFLHAFLRRHCPWPPSTSAQYLETRPSLPCMLPRPLTNRCHSSGCDSANCDALHAGQRRTAASSMRVYLGSVHDCLDQAQRRLVDTSNTRMVFRTERQARRHPLATHRGPLRLSGARVGITWQQESVGVGYQHTGPWLCAQGKQYMTSSQITRLRYRRRPRPTDRARLLPLRAYVCV